MKILKVMYANLPHDQINSRRNLFFEITSEYPDIDIFAFSELYWNPNTSHSQAPPEYYILTHSKLKKKNTAILIKKELQPQIKQRKSEYTETSILVSAESKFGITVMYRSPSDSNRAPIYRHIKFPGNENQEINYIRWMARRIESAMTAERGRSREIVCGDFNLDIHNFKRKTRIERTDRIGAEL